MTLSTHRLVPYKSRFYYAIRSATRLDSSREKWKSNWHKRIKITVESRHWIRKKDHAEGGGKEAKCEMIETEVKQEWMEGIDSTEGAPVLCQSLFPCWYVFRLPCYSSKQAFFLLEKQVTKPAWLLIQLGVLLCLVIALASRFLGPVLTLRLVFCFGQ